MNDALKAVVILCCCWVALVAVVKILLPWLSKILPESIEVNVTWYSISLHSSYIPPFLKKADLSEDTVVGAVDPHSTQDFLFEIPNDDDDGKKPPNDQVIETQREEVIPTSKPKREVGYRLWRMFGLNSHSWHKFYSIGAIVACILGVCVVVFCIVNPFVTVVHVIDSARAAAKAAATRVQENPDVANTPAFIAEANTRFQPIIPGITLPFRKVIGLLLAIAICGVFHELGHAYAAAIQGYAVQGVGIEVYLLLIPKFYADIEGTVQYAPSEQSLRVFCGGVWHNVVMGSLAFLFVAQVSSLSFYALYTTPEATPIVAEIPYYSPMKSADIEIGDKLDRVGDCIVNDTKSWEICLDILADHNSPKAQKGYCLPKVSDHLLGDEDSIDDDLFYYQMDPWIEKRGNPTVEQCCKSGYNKFGQCFSVTDWSPGMRSNMIQRKWCLEPHSLVANAVGRCSEAGRECFGENASGICVIPVLPKDEVLAELYFSHKSSSKPTNVLYAGTVSTLWNSLVLSDYAKRFSFVFPYAFVDFALSFCFFIFSVSAGLAVTNVAPCKFFDGNFIAVVILLQLGYPPNCKVTRLIINISTALFAINFVCVIVSYIL